MKRKLIPVVSVVAVALAALTALAGTATAQKAHHAGFFGGGFIQETVVKGTVTAVDASAGTFTATVDVVQTEGGHGFGLGGGQFFKGPGNDGGSQGWGPGFRASDGFRGIGGFNGGFNGRFHNDQTSTTPTTTTPTTPTPTPTTVTITTNSSTRFIVNGDDTATIANLAAGDRFIATFASLPTPPTMPPTPGMSNSTRAAHHERLVGDQAASVPTTPALQVIAEAPPQLYAFVGTVTATDTTSGTVTVNVTSSLPAGLFTGAQTFDVGPQTLVFGGTSTSLIGNVSNITVGDVVAGGEIGMGGETAAQVEANPLQVLVDFSTTAPSTSPTTTTPAATAMFKDLRNAKLNRAVKRLMKHHRAAKRTHRAKHDAKHHAKKDAKNHAKHHAKHR